MSAQLEALRLHLADHPLPPVEAGRGGNALVVGSGKGGVGTSLLSALLALGAASAGAEVLLVDGDASLGSLHLLLACAAAPGLEELRGNDRSPDGLVVPVTERLGLLPRGRVAGGASSAERQGLFRRVAALYPRYDLVVVDGGSRLDSVLGACAAGAAGVLIAATPDRIALTATYALAKVLTERFADLPVEMIVNRADTDAAELAAEEVRSATLHFLRRPLGCAGAVPEDASLRTAIEAGMCLQDAAAGSPAAERIERVSCRVLDRLATAPRPVERHHLQRRS